MKLEEFDYNLPRGLIAQKPVSPRDHSRLLVLGKDNDRRYCSSLSRTINFSTRVYLERSREARRIKIEHRHFYDIVEYLNPGDLLVLNNSKVFQARLIGQKEITGGEVEILLNHEIDSGLWEAIGSNLRVGNRIKFKNSNLKAAILSKTGQIYKIRMNMGGTRLNREIEKIGLPPLPPYIKRDKKQETRNKNKDKKDYQTVYAKEKGSVAAPTAGLHFTKSLLKKIQDKGVKVEYLTLHVGLGTFAPVKVNKIEKHRIHPEYFSIRKKTFENIIKAKKENRRIIAVGTTTTRVLETLFRKSQIMNRKQILNQKSKNDSHPALDAGSKKRSGSISGFPIESGMTNNNITTCLPVGRVQQFDPSEEHKASNKIFGFTNIFIYPGFQFKCVDALITNFHLPKSTLLMLVSAFAGKKNIDEAYREAISKKYRFYSYGDAMLIE